MELTETRSVFIILPNVKAQRRSGLARHVQLGAHAVTSHSVRCSAWFGSVVFIFQCLYDFIFLRMNGTFCGPINFLLQLISDYIGRTLLDKLIYNVNQFIEITLIKYIL